MCTGARVLLACRDMTKANKAADEIRKKTGNGNVVVKHLDLTSLQSVRDLAKDILENEDRLDILINNAGAVQSHDFAKAVIIIYIAPPPILKSGQKAPPIY